MYPPVISALYAPAHGELDSWDIKSC